ncbi:putative carotenoid cleavage dioxygenase 4, chloroplastic [Sesamum alatum]|uniref:Carotenoid cleavage dioxygenase 4, chloroplastic n=1 Tax=Sesamum alatum TaxID=300844 RepID=A0AAE2CHP1_9LAMI|nr:putative carotenoid cleavage dioxygenase 4, chloroplastic [Sesamum alatum]
MEALSSSFLATPFPHSSSLNCVSSSFRISAKRSDHQPNSSFTLIFNPINKLITNHTAQTLDHQILKNKPPPVAQKIKKKQSSLLVNIFKTLDDLICSFLDLPLRPSIDPNHVLSGNFAPVDELPPTACEVVEGSLPSCLDGAYIRNGPNPHFIPPGPYHLFDGDGMLHMIRISLGQASFCSRYVKTYKYMVEQEIGYPIFPSAFSSFNGFGASMARSFLTIGKILTGQFDPITHGFGVANTSLAFFAGHLFALCESDIPYAIKLTPDGDIVTIGRHDFQRSSSEPFFSMTAHPKIDRETGEAFAFRCHPLRPFLTFFIFNSDGRKHKDVPIYSAEGSTLSHDFAVTKNYAIFPDVQIVMNLLWILKGRSPVGVDSAKVPRLGVMPRYAEDERELRWIDVPGFNMLHCFNAWEEDGAGGDTIVIVASNAVKVEHVLERIELAELTIEKLTINVKNKTLQMRHRLSPRVLDFGVINPAYAAKKSRYIYAAEGGSGIKRAGLAKVDLSLSTANSDDCVVASRLYGPGCFGGEPFFIAREPDNPAAEEDDGYLVTYIHNEITEESKFLVMDAKSPSLEIVASVKLPQRVPYGFHGLFVREDDLNKLL